MHKTFILAAAVASLALPAAAQSSIVVNGTAESAYGAPLAVQDTLTNFGDSAAGTPTPTGSGSELDAAYGVVQNGTLYLLLAGNLEGNRNKLEVFLDTVPGQGQNALRGNNPAAGDLQRLSADPAGGMGLTFDSGFAPDFYLSVNGGVVGATGATPYTLYVDYATLPTQGGGKASYVGYTRTTGPASTGALTGGAADAPAILAALDNSNTAGVTGAAATGGGSVKTGVELAIPLSALGNPTGPISVCAFLNGSAGNFVSNQALGGLGGYSKSANLGEPRAVNFASIPGNQFFIIPKRKRPV